MTQELPVQDVLACSQCGRTLPHSDLVHIAGNWVCADCKPAFLSRVMANGAAAASPHARTYAGFWIRFGARMIDGLIFTVPIIIVALLWLPSLIRTSRQAPTQVNPFAVAGYFTFIAFFLLMSAAYEILMLKFRSATLGKLACGIKVIRPDGSPLGWGVCVGRYFMWNIVTAGIPYINFVMMLVSSIMLGVDDQKRALHDRVCDTRVVAK